MEANERRIGKMTQSAPSETYNYDHFRPSIMTEDFRQVLRPAGPHPGERAPEFFLEDTDGRTWRLSELTGRPVVLILGSASCPMTVGALPALRELYREYGDRAQWLLMYVREAHPGAGLPAHGSYEQKLRHAEFLKRDDEVEWPVIVDDLRGTTHRLYGMLPNPVFLIDADGRIAFRGNFAHAPTLRRALDHLFAQGQRGTVPGGEDHMLHLLGAMTYGWDAIHRSGQDAVHDVLVGAPPLAANLWMGQRMRPALDPLARRSRSVPVLAKLGIAAGAGLIGLGVWRAVRHGAHQLESRP